MYIEYATLTYKKNVQAYFLIKYREHFIEIDNVFFVWALEKVKAVVKKYKRSTFKVSDNVPRRLQLQKICVYQFNRLIFFKHMYTYLWTSKCSSEIILIDSILLRFPPQFYFSLLHKLYILHLKSIHHPLNNI